MKNYLWALFSTSLGCLYLWQFYASGGCMNYRSMVVCDNPAKVALAVVIAVTMSATCMLLIKQFKKHKYPESPKLTEIQKQIEEQLMLLANKYGLPIADRFRKYHFNFLFLRMGKFSVWIFDKGNIDLEYDGKKESFRVDEFSSDQNLAESFKNAVEFQLNENLR